MGAGGASEDSAATEGSGEERSASVSEEGRLRSGSGTKAEEEEEDEVAEPGRRRVSVSAVSSKSRPDAAEDSVELRSVSTDMAGRRGWGPQLPFRAGARERREGRGRSREEGEGKAETVWL